MKVAAVICEYNPFHNGHKYQIEKAREVTGCNAVVGMMSGNFVQRGDFAVFDKVTRADAAISCGVDLIIENPATFVLRSAEGYADAAVKTLSSLGCIDYLFFGAEHDSLDDLQKIAQLLATESVEFKKLLTEYMSEGTSFPRARASAVSDMLGKEAEEILGKPNNLLSIEYLKALIRQKSNLEPVLIQRTCAEHHSMTPNGNFASATYIREQIVNGNYDALKLVPKEVEEAYSKSMPFSDFAAEKAIMSAICLMPKEKLKMTPDISEGLENKIKDAVMNCESLDKLYESVKSKRYAYSRVRRSILCAFLGITEDDAKLSPKYIKPIAFNDIGQEILNMAKKTASLPIAKNARAILKDNDAMSIWRRELEFDRIYEILKK